MAKSHDEMIEEAKQLVREGRIQDIRGVRYHPYKDPQFVVIDSKEDKATRRKKPVVADGYPAGGGPAATSLAAVDNISSGESVTDTSAIPTNPPDVTTGVTGTQ